MKLDFNLNLEFKVSEQGNVYFYVYDVIELKEDGSTLELNSYSSEAKANSCADAMNHALGTSCYVSRRLVFVS